MTVAESSLATAQELDFLAVACHLTQKLPRLGIEHRRADRDLYYSVLPILAERTVFASRLTVSGENMTLIAQMKEGPHIAVPLEDNMSSASSVAPVRSPFGHIFGTVEMTASGSSLSGAAEYLYIIYEV